MWVKVALSGYYELEIGYVCIYVRAFKGVFIIVQLIHNIIERSRIY